jgi:PKD repeat protein
VTRIILFINYSICIALSSGFLFVPVNPTYASSGSILINEVLYDPEGTDTGYEWIELVNISDENIDLTGWSIQVAGSIFVTKTLLPTYSLAPNSIVLVGEPLVAEADIAVQSLAMQNGGSETDGVRILDPEGRVVDTLLYDSPNSNGLSDDRGIASLDTAIDVTSGYSLARTGKMDTDSSSSDFSVCDHPTPGISNTFPPTAQISAPKEAYIKQEVLFDGTDSSDTDGIITSYTWTIEKEGVSITSSTQATFTYVFSEIGPYSVTLIVTDNDSETQSTQAQIVISEDPEHPVIASISDAKKKPLGTTVTIEGSITVPPGILYQSDGYVQDSSAGIRFKAPPEIPISYSSRYQITGVVSSVYGELRLNIVRLALISQGNPTLPTTVISADLLNYIGSLVTIDLTIKQKSGRTLFSYETNPSTLISLYISDLSGIDTAPFRAHGQVSVTGIVSQYGKTDDGTPKLRLMPRFEDDIQINSDSELALTGQSLKVSLWAFWLIGIVFFERAIKSEDVASGQ